MNGVPKEIVLSQRQISESLAEPVGAITDAVKAGLENTAPELAADIVDKGIVLAGGCALLGNLDQVLRHATGRSVCNADQALRCVVLGTGLCLQEMTALKRALHEGTLRQRRCSPTAGVRRLRAGPGRGLAGGAAPFQRHRAGRARRFVCALPAFAAITPTIPSSAGRTTPD